MPTTFIPKIGDVEYTSTELLPGKKGVTLLGILDAPILISEKLSPGAKTDYVVAHEVGHRLTYDMVVNAYEESPALFDAAPNPLSGLIRYFMDLGLTKDSLIPLHPGTQEQLSNIFIDNKVGRWTDELVAQEFIAEVFANWATDKGNIPAPIAKRFDNLVRSKNALLKIPHREAAFDMASDDSKEKIIAVGVIALLAWFIFRQPQPAK